MNTDQQVRFDRSYDQHLRALKRHGKATRTVEAYGLAVRRLAGFVDDCPDELTTHNLNAYFARLIGCTRERRFRVFWLATYSMGLRLGEAMKLEVADVDSAHMRVHVRLGKGNKVRFVILPSATLDALRRWWAVHRHPRWVFPGQASTMDAPATHLMDRSTIQRAFKRAAEDVGIRKRVSIHSLRHSYATHMVDAGLSLRGVQDQLGHASPTTTARYVRMTEVSREHQDAVINGIVERLTVAVRARAG